MFILTTTFKERNTITSSFHSFNNAMELYRDLENLDVVKTLDLYDTVQAKYLDILPIESEVSQEPCKPLTGFSLSYYDLDHEEHSIDFPSLSDAYRESVILEESGLEILAITKCWLD